MTTPTTPRLLIPDGVQMTLKLVQSGQTAAIVLGGVGAGYALSTANANVWRDAAWDALRPLMAGTVSCTGAVVRRVSIVDSPVIEVGAPTVTTGGAGTSLALASGCTLIKWSTTSGGRSGKGRTYLPGLAQTAVNADGRTYTAAQATAVTTAVTAYLGNAAFSGANVLRPAILSFRRGIASPITGGSLAAIVGTQRRRMR